MSSGQGRQRALPVTIPTDADGLSDALNLGAEVIVGIFMPADWTAGDITFQSSADGGTTYWDVYDQNDAEVVIQAAADRHIVITPTTLLGLGEYIKVRSGTSGTPVQQGAARTLYLITRGLA